MARVSGLVSGLDTDALIQELVSAYQTKQETYVKKQTKLEWTQEIWKGLNSKVYSFYTGALRNARFSQTYNLKKATVSDATKATVSASSSAVTGTQTLQVKQLAKTAYLTGGKVSNKSGGKLSGKSKLSELANFGENGTNGGTIKVNIKGKEKEISVNENTTINQFVTKLKDAGLSANFDETNQRLFVSAGTSGAGNEFSLTAGDAGGLNVLNSLGLNAVSKSEAATYKAASELDVRKEADTAYAKYVLTQANNKLTADINSYKAEITKREDYLKYINDTDYNTQLNDSWTNSIQSYNDTNKTLSDKIDEKLAVKGNDTASNPQKMSDFISKEDASDPYSKYTLADKYYEYEYETEIDEDGNEVIKTDTNGDKIIKKDDDGNDIFKTDANGNRIINKEALTKDLENTGLDYNQVVSQLNSINADVASIKRNDEAIDSINTKKSEYDAAATQGETKLNTEIDDYNKKIETAQNDIARNQELMKDAYTFGVADSDIAYTVKHTNAELMEALDADPTLENTTAYTASHTYSELMERLESGEVSETDSVAELSGKTYKDIKDELAAGTISETDQAYTTNVTYKDIKDGLDAGTMSETDVAYTTGVTFQDVKNQMTGASDSDIIYTDDAGKDWTKAELDKVFTASGTDNIEYKETDDDGNVTKQWTNQDLKNLLNQYTSDETISANASQYDAYYQKYAQQQQTGKELYDAYQVYTSEDATDAEKAEAAKKLNIDTNSENGAVRVEGQDAEIVLNGANFTSTTNNFSINGLTITATGETGDDVVTINTTTDIDGMYKSVKSLISGFNDILKEMNTLFYASSSKGYEPLSDEEKEALTDTEVEKWEKKIKDSLLRRDDTLSSIMSVMKNSMAKSYTINGKSYSLSTFGINTSGYFAVDNEDRGLYHIDGDSEDTMTSGNSDKLRAALASDPDSAIQFFQKIADDMYSTLTKKMSRTSLSSSYTIYNDKQMDSQYRNYTKIIDDWDDKIERYTQKYVKQFTAMETAMSKLQSSTSALSGLLG